MALFFVEKSSSVAYQVFHIPCLRSIHGGIVDLCQRAPPDGVPNLAVGRVCGSDSILVSSGPSGRYSRRSEGNLVSSELRHVFSAHLAIDLLWKNNGVCNMQRFNYLEK